MTRLIPRPIMQGLLLDVEGTTTSVAFVYDVLFPYARTELAAFVAQRGLTSTELADLRAEHAADARAQATTLPWDERSEGLCRYLDWLMAHDRKSPALKSVQGRIWEAGYRSGTLRGHVYPDVPPALARWTSASPRAPARRVFIYSSGSELAQRLLFAHTTAGDLTPRISGYFDTRVGPKRESASYAAIVDRVGLEPDKLLFISDVEAELSAARSAGLLAVLCARETPPAASEFPVIGSFDELP